jgi:hypothetical protein
MDGEGAWTGCGCRWGRGTEVDLQDGAYESRESADNDALPRQWDARLLAQHEVAYGRDGSEGDPICVYLPARASRERSAPKAWEPLEGRGIRGAFVAL